VNYINQPACHDLSVERVLRKTQRVSKMTFRKHFLAATGQTPGEAIRQLSSRKPPTAGRDAAICQLGG
jgi:LacI family transcriptional regulator